MYERIKAPLMTLVSSGSAEQSYAVLCHLHLLVMRAPVLFSSDYKHFYCRYSDPSYIKKLKLEMLTAVANENNTYEIGEYCLIVIIPVFFDSISVSGALFKYLKMVLMMVDLRIFSLSCVCNEVLFPFCSMLNAVVMRVFSLSCVYNEVLC